MANDPSESHSNVQTESISAAVKRMLSARRMDIKDKEGLVYLIWADNSADLDDKIEALTAISESLGSNMNDRSCSYSGTCNLKTFLIRYCRIARCLKRELLSSEHGIDFSWKLITDNETLLPGSSQNEEQLGESNTWRYGELDLCIEAAEDAASTLEVPTCIEIAACYWMVEGYRFKALFNGNRSITRIESEDLFVDSCAYLYTTKAVEDEVNRAIWQAKSKQDKEAKRFIAHYLEDGYTGKFNAFVELKKYPRLFELRRHRCKDYMGIMDAFRRIQPTDMKWDREKLEHNLEKFFPNSNRSPSSSDA